MPKRTNNYSEEDLEAAIEEIKRGEAIKSMSKKYGIPRGTIQNRLSGRCRKSTFGPPTILTTQEEDIIVKWLIKNQQKGFPRRKEDIQSAVQEFLKDNPKETPFKNNIPGNKWYQGFLKRHKELEKRVPESVTDASFKVSECDIRNWFSGITDYLEKENLMVLLNDAKRIYNGDETNFSMCPKNRKVIAQKGSRNVYETDRGQAKENITVMFSFSAAGDIVPPMAVYPYKRMPVDIIKSIPEGIDWQKSDSIKTKEKRRNSKKTGGTNSFKTEKTKRTKRENEHQEEYTENKKTEKG